MTQRDDRNVFAKALDLANLNFDWDSYGSEVIDERAIHSACEFLVEHFEKSSRESAIIVPTLEGGVQVEWHVDEVDLEIEWSKNGQLSGLYRTDEKARLPVLDYDLEQHSAEVVESWAISASSEWPPRTV